VRAQLNYFYLHAQFDRSIEYYMHAVCNLCVHVQTVLLVVYGRDNTQVDDDVIESCEAWAHSIAYILSLLDLHNISAVCTLLEGVIHSLDCWTLSCACSLLV
jgi:hypothetical protein